MTLTRADFEREQMARRNAEGKAEAARAEVVRLRGKIAKLEMGEPDAARKHAEILTRLGNVERDLQRARAHLADTKGQLESYRAQLAEQRAGYTELLQQAKARHLQDVRRLEDIIKGLPSEGDVQDAEERAAFAEARLRERPDVVELARLRAEVDKLKREAKVE